MDCYLASFTLKLGVRDTDFVAQVERFMTHLTHDGLIESHRLLRRKLGLGPAALGEFLLIMEVRDLAQLERAFQTVGSRGEPFEGEHFAVNSKVADVFFALYRDFPDSFRLQGQEKF